MLSINTNLSSIIAQHSMNTATAKLDQAIERMTTGAKINHAKDNAANYSISTNMTTKMNSYMVAQDNVAIGMEMVGTAESVISQMHDHAIRLRELATQARNNTYGADSLQAIQSEANARIAEIARLYSSSEFNGISLFEDVNASPAVAMFATPRAVTTEPTFIANPKTYDDATVEAMNSIDTFTDGASGNFKIEDADDLAYLATIVNDKNWNTANATFVLADNINLTEWNATHGNWVPIGTSSKAFKGTFDGNGHIIKSLTINKPTADYQGLFGYVDGSNIKNLGLENVSISAHNYIGGLLGKVEFLSENHITNCYVLGEIIGNESIGGAIGSCGSSRTYIDSCFADADVMGTSNIIGGFAGELAISVSNSYSRGDVSGSGSKVGGFIGLLKNSDDTAINCYATGNVTNSAGIPQGLIGEANGTVTNCGSVQADSKAALMTEEEIYAILGLPLPTPPPPAGGTGGGTATGGIELQVGIHNDANSRISFNTYFQYDLSEVGLDIGSDASLSAIDDFIDVLSAKETELGAVSNRLESVLDEIEIQYNNLASSRSTIRDADIAEVSSEYIKMQILQQASSTLLATANQTPSIALKLI